MIKVLVVEDSPVVREFLVHVLSSDPQIEVIGTANNGEEALKVIEEKKPDVITMDINMPRMDGFEATRRIMESRPTPIRHCERELEYQRGSDDIPGDRGRCPCCCRKTNGYWSSGP